jgi:hypothetical protein
MIGAVAGFGPSVRMAPVAGAPPIVWIAPVAETSVWGTSALFRGVRSAGSPEGFWGMTGTLAVSSTESSFRRRCGSVDAGSPAQALEKGGRKDETIHRIVSETPS